jgi:uncharacterized protein YdiU (UPF0061 family)
MHAQRVDFTSAFRSLADAVRGDASAARLLFVGDLAAFDAWAGRWRARLERDGADPRERAAAMDRVNPRYIARNHHVEDALGAATEGDLGPFDRLLEVVRAPFDERPGLEAYEGPAPESFGAYRTFCGT